MNIIRQDYEVLFTKDFLQKVSKDDYKIVLYDRTIIKVIPSEKIEKVRSSGKEVNESLANIVEIVRNINRNEITEDEKFLLIDNFKWFNRKIKVLNQSILDNQFKIKMLDNRNLFVEIEEKKIVPNKWKEDVLFDSTLQTLNFYSNKDQSDQFIAYLNNFELSENGRINFANIWINLPLYLKNNITIKRVFLSLTLDNRVETISKLPLADQTAYLLTANDQIIREYYERKSFLKNYNLEELDPIKCLDTLTEDIKHILVKIVQLKDKKVFQMQNHPLFRFLISKELQNVTKELLDYPTIIDIQITDPAYQALLCAERCQQFISSDNLLKVLGFVRNNGEIIKLHGEQSKSRPHLRKFKKVIYKIPFDIHYDTNKDDTYIQLGFLGKGTYKTVKQQIKIALGLPIQAVAKQGLDLKKSVALNELKILEMARGLPHVISFLETSRYFSKKKAKNILSITYPMYNMGELYECMHSTEFSYIKKLELTIEIIKGLMGLHKRNIIHRDIKPENIFLHKSFENGKEVEHAFVGDFGLSCIVFNDPLRLDFSGSKLYMPPAMLEGKEFANCEMDIWALGIVVSEFFIGNSPVQKIDIESVLIETTKKLGDLKLNPEPTNKSSIEYVIWKLMQPELFKRMKLAEALFIFEDLLLKEKAHCK